MKTRIMYIEDKSGGLSGPARIGRVTLASGRKTLRYGGRTFSSLRGRGHKANFFDQDTLERFWISGPHKDGRDKLYPGVVEVDEDVREEYWRDIRGLPEQAHKVRFRSPGTKRD